RWAGGDESHTQFAVVLFAGMIVHTLFAEVLNRAPTIILSNVNYVKKVVFPLEILAVVSVGAALFHALVSLLVLLVAFSMLNGFIHWTTIFVPLVLLPLMILSLGFGWILSSLGVFVRDIGQFIGVFTSALMFLSPVFFPVSALPEPMQVWLHLNPLTFFIEQTREVLIWGHLPDWKGLMFYLIGASVFAWFGFFWFQATRKGFSDVL
ncbi:MAG: ABC transporter permease, partial [Thiobacillus sp.]|nr:ABC transporter permease [Thiobacillus sp.]